MIGVEHPKRLATLLELLQVDGDRVARGSGDVGDVELFQARAVSLENKNKKYISTVVHEFYGKNRRSRNFRKGHEFLLSHAIYLKCNF